MLKCFNMLHFKIKHLHKFSTLCQWIEERLEAMVQSKTSHLAKVTFQEQLSKLEFADIGQFMKLPHICWFKVCWVYTAAHRMLLI